MRPSLIRSTLVAVGLTVSMASAASAQNPFNIDGTMPDAGQPGVTDPNGNAKELGPKNAGDTKIGYINKAAIPMLSFTNPNSSVDLNKVYLSNKKAANLHNWVYFAWVRDSVNGSGFVSLEADVAPSDCTYPITTENDCNPWGNRANGDALFSWDQQGNSHDIYFRVFNQALNAGKGGFETPANCPGVVTGLGCKLDPAVADAEYNADFSGGELALDFTALQVGNPNSCQLVGNVIPGTVTGNSDTADYKDVVLEPLSIDLCGKVTVEKVTQNAAGTVILDATSIFHYTLTGNAGALSAGSNIQAGSANKKTHADLLPAIDYKLVEDTVASGYTLVSIFCDGVDTNKGANAFEVKVSVTTACVITNRQNPRLPTLATVPKVALRDSVFLSNLLRLAGDDPTAFTVTFRLYDTVAACIADTNRTGGTAFVRTLTLTGDSGTAETHAQGSGVEKPAGEYAWWVKFSGNKINNLDINLPQTGACGDEKTVIGFPQ